MSILAILTSLRPQCGAAARTDWMLGVARRRPLRVGMWRYDIVAARMVNTVMTALSR